MGRATVYTEALRRAATAIGGEQRLAIALKLPKDQIERWLSGEEAPPMAVYHQALDLLIGTGAA